MMTPQKVIGTLPMSTTLPSKRRWVEAEEANDVAPQEIDGVELQARLQARAQRNTVMQGCMTEKDEY